MGSIFTLRHVNDAKQIDEGMPYKDFKAHTPYLHSDNSSKKQIALRSCFNNVKQILLAAKEGKRLVVIGSSFISMELVVAVQNRKLASIDVIGMEEFPFEGVLGKEIGAGLKKVMSDQTHRPSLGYMCLRVS